MLWGIQDEIKMEGEHLCLVLEQLRYAYVVLYLASDEAAFVTGTELVIDGGTTAAYFTFFGVKTHNSVVK